MSTKKKLLQAAAGSAVSLPDSIESVFNTYLYTGNDTSTAIDNEIDLAGEGGLVWVKARSTSVEHVLYDTERGPLKPLQSQSTAAELNQSTGLSSFNSNGFTVGTNGNINGSPHEYVSWTFRKSPKFFDVVTYTGNGGTQTLAHNLDDKPGAIIVKRYDSTSDWYVYHRSSPSPEDKYILLNSINKEVTSTSFWGSTGPTTTHFTVNNTAINANGASYVAYLFAHNDGDGIFGPNEDQDIIKCGSYTSNASNDGPEVNLGFEPQWLMVKNIDHTGNYTRWDIIDNMRGANFDTPADNEIFANATDSDRASFNVVDFKPKGFKIVSTIEEVNSPAFQRYIYIAIRRGPLRVPTNSSEVFAIDSRTNSSGDTPAFTSNFVTDWSLYKNITGLTGFEMGVRMLQGRYLRTYSSGNDNAAGGFTFDFMDGYSSQTGAFSSVLSWMWKRAPQFCDVLHYVGDGTGDRKIEHNLEVKPEMIWLKPTENGDSYTGNWFAWHKDFGTSVSNFLMLNNNGGYGGDQQGGINPVHSFDVDGISPNIRGGGTGEHNINGVPYLVIMFASLDGISKVGSYTGNGVDGRVIDCGFSSGARFVMIKRTDYLGDWQVWDTERGLVAGNDSLLALNVEGAETTNTDLVDPHSSGFTVSSSNLVNVSNAEYIFYAIA